MAILTEMKGLRGYPTMALPSVVLVALDKAVGNLNDSRKHGNRSYPLNLKLLDCYCDLVDKPITIETFKTPKLQELFNEFCAAVMSGDLIETSMGARRLICRNTEIVLKEAELLNEGFSSVTLNLDELYRYREQWACARDKIPSDKKLFWCGWILRDRSGAQSYLPISRLWVSHGKDFSIEVFNALNTHISGERSANISLFRSMINYLSNNPIEWPVDTFKSPFNIYKFTCSFCKKFFKKAELENYDLVWAKKTWNRFISRVEQYFIKSGTWATPFRALPRADTPRGMPHQTHLTVSSDGVILKEKLLTSIPLHITDSAAIERTLISISDDLNIVRSWASAQCAEIMANCKNRKLLATLGAPIDPRKRVLTNLSSLENICATFEKFTYDWDLKKLLTHFSIRSKCKISQRQFSYNLGIPTTRSLFPFQCLLVLENPQITHSFLENFQLYDKNGQLTGLIIEDEAYHLTIERRHNRITGLKPRRGKANARQTFSLSERAKEIIEQIIELTTPARDYLRSKNDDNWRYLFLGSPVGTAYPTRSKRPDLRNPASELLLKEFTDQFTPHTTLRGALLKKFIFKISLGSIRASRAAEIFIQTGNSKLASEALGHKREQTAQLENYIPKPLIDHIETRGVRVIQKVIICHALANSPLLLEASNFESFEILDAFLRNHVDPKIPELLKDPEGLERKELADLEQDIIFRVGVGTLATLISLSQAISSSEKPTKIDPTAQFWARISDLIVKEIERLHDPLLKKHLHDARSAADPLKVEHLIYAHTV